ncbi:phosphate ABC transporter permease PstA [Jiangella alkaliphila]|uniref:Phosphate transport system permease protein PstA n=1 Tax=Jiangella alkaliphila TaxID=419479 RepID=A0A1H2KWF1_9ACTN|nr:phosphate ABC transporter permease PstA [Jiangella alkaliphila]SDU73009.1 phosphate transport system permease protein [Jiangella alkaliphila]
MTVTTMPESAPGEVTTADAPATTERPPQLPPAQSEALRRTSPLRRTDILALIGSAIAALAVTTLFFSLLTPFDGVIGYVVVAYVLFLAFYALLVSYDESGPAVRDRLSTVVMHSAAIVVLTALVSVVAFTFWRGREPMTHWNFYTQDLRAAGPLEGLEVGGVLHGMAGTLIMIAIAIVITVPLGLVCAVFLSEFPGRYSRFVRTIVEAMTALPSIVAGLFIYATVVVTLGLGFSGFAAALALSVMMLPIVIRAADVVLRLVPGTLKEASYGLGAGHWRTVWHVTLPTARSGLTTSVILGTARGIGETSPVLLTAGMTTHLNLNPLEGPMVSLPLLTFDLVRSPEPAYISRGFGAAALLMIIVLALFVAARIVGGRGPGQLTRRQQRRRMAASRREAGRYADRDRRHALPTGPGENSIDGLPESGAGEPGGSR